MSETGHGRLTRLFLEAAELRSDERAAFLERRCSDPRLREQVASLLEHDTAEGGAVITGVFAGSPVRTRHPPPRRIGPYVIGDLLGDGGMGDVYVATQTAPVLRRVAIKLMKPQLATPAFVARFEAERQAVASMSHPHVAQIFDAGVTACGRPYFVMEFIEGLSITEYADRECLSVADRLELFCKVCSGVQHAHQKAVIHRDLKPANVLVATPEGEPVPKIIDFGIAKPLGRGPEPRGVTLAGPVGTPDYMSPEQFHRAAVVDTRTDVYQLGALLYELLTGAPPFAGLTGSDTIEGMARLIAEGSVPPPSSRPAHPRIGGPLALRGELDWIALRALQREPGQRYASPAELAADIRRHLEGQPVAAGPPGALYRTRKFLGRHRLGAAVVASLAAGLVVLMLSTVIQNRRIAAERDRANREAHAARQLSDYVLGLFDLSEEAVTDQEMQYYASVLERSMNRIETELSDQPELQAELMRRMTAGYRMHSLMGTAESALDQAHAAVAAHLGEDHPETLALESVIGSDLNPHDDHERAERQLRETVRRATDILGPRHSTTLQARVHLARAYQQMGRHEQAGTILRETLTTAEAHLGRDHRVTLRAVTVAGSNLLDAGRHAEAETLLRSWEPALRSNLAPTDVDRTVCEYNLGCLAALRGDRHEALERIRAAIDGGFYFAGHDALGKPISGPEAMLDDPYLASLAGDPELQRIADAGEALGRAMMRARDGDHEAALALLHRAATDGFRGTSLLRWHPSLAGLRSRPEFVELLGALGERASSEAASRE